MSSVRRTTIVLAIVGLSTVVLLLIASAGVAAVGSTVGDAEVGVDESVPSLVKPGPGDLHYVQTAPDETAGTANRTADGTLVLSVPTSDVGDAGNSTEFSVAVTDAAAGPAATVEATEEGDRYVARVPLTDVVGPNASADLSAATVVARHDGAVVLEDTADLRYVAQTGPATFRNATLAIPADVRGLGASTPTLVPTGDGPASIETAVDGVGPNATLSIAPPSLSGIATNRTVSGPAVVGNATVSPEPLSFSIGDAAGRGTEIRYRNAVPVVVQPLLHPDVGPERVTVTVSTEDPEGIYAVTPREAGGTENARTVPSVTVPASVVGANSIQVSVQSDDGLSLLETSVTPPSRETVSLRIANGSLHAPNPDALSGYDALLLRDDTVSHVQIEPGLRTGIPQQLETANADPSDEATAILVGEGSRPARVDLTVVPRPPDPGPQPTPTDPEQDEFVAIWLDVGAMVVLLLVAMIGSVVSVGTAYGLRRLSPARSAAAGPRAVVGHFLFGGVCGVLCIALVQSALWGPALGTVVLAGTEIGLGALLVGLFHGGLTATGIRLGLGTVEAWPTRRVIDETAVPVRVRFTDDREEAIPGEQTVVVRRTTDGSVVETAALAGTTTEVELPAGEYAVRGQTAERETDAVELAIEEPRTSRPDTRSVHLTVARPGLQVEVTDAQRGDPVADGQVTVSTDREETKSAEIEDGTVTTTLPVATGTVTAVVSAPGYDDATVETPIESDLTTVDVELDPASGTLVATALVAGEPIEDAAIAVEPVESAEDGGETDESGGSGATGEGADSPTAGASPATGADGERPDVGVRTTEVTTDQDGRATVELPAGSYRAELVLDGPNTELFAVKGDVVTVAADAEATATVHARFDWEPAEQVRRRAAGLRKTIRSVAEEATADPTIPLYFAGATEALLDCVDALSSSGQYFATSTRDPDEVAAATVAAAEAALEAVGQAMQAEGVRAVLARSSREPARTPPDLDATPADLLAYLEQDLTIASVEARAHEVEATIEREAERVASVAPALAVVERAVALVDDGDASTHATTREFAALLLLEAVEKCFDDPEVRRRLDAAL